MFSWDFLNIRYGQMWVIGQVLRQKNFVGSRALLSRKCLTTGKFFQWNVKNATKKCNFLKLNSPSPQKYFILQSFYTIFKVVWKHSECFEMFPDIMESLWTLWKVSEHSGKFMTTLESFQRILTNLIAKKMIKSYNFFGNFKTISVMANYVFTFSLFIFLVTL